MAKREEEKKKRAEDPEEEGGLDTSSDRAEEDEETAREGADASDDSDSSEDDEEDKAAEDDEEEDEDEDEKAASDDEDEEEARKSEPTDESGEEPAADEPLAAADDEESDAPAAAQLGTQRYVLSAFFGASLLFAYLLGRAIDGIWLNLATRDWLVERAPILAAVQDDDKALYATIAGGVIALVVAIHTSRKPDVRQWSDDVSSELLKVKWPTRKEVYASTVVVLTTSAVAVVYLFLLDRFWGFVTNQIYGTGL